jgi:LPXTG-motif cell wall-anchored protein
VPANERSHDDQPATSVRRRRSRLLVHATVLVVAGLAILAFGPTSTSAAPTVQEGRYLEGGDIDVTYTCAGADAFTQNLLAGIQLTSFPLDVNIRSAAVEPSPSPGEDFEMEFTWDYTLGANLVQTAVDLAVESFNITGVNRIGVVSGATGADSVGNGGPTSVVLGDGSVPVGYTHGPFTATFNRTAAVDEPIVFAPGQITSSVTTVPSNITLNIVCDPDETTMTLNDVTGTAPSTTTTTRPSVVTTVPSVTPTTAAVGGTGELPRTGTSSNLFLAFLGLALIDIGYLALSSSRQRLGRTSSVS